MQDLEEGWDSDSYGRVITKRFTWIESYIILYPEQSVTKGRFTKENNKLINNKLINK